MEGGGGGNIYLEESSDSEEEEEGGAGSGSSGAGSLSLDSWTTFRCSQEAAAQVAAQVHLCRSGFIEDCFERE